MLIIISGCSQSGKTTLTNLLLKDNNFTRIITATSRKPRNGEFDKVDYYFLNNSDFSDRSKFVENALVHGNYYGTLKKELEDKLKSNKNVIWIIDVYGVNYILNKYKNLIKGYVSVFLLPDKLSTLMNRINIKKDPNIKERIKSIKKELSYLHLFHYIINTSQNINENLNDLKAIINDDKQKIKKIMDYTKNFNLNKFLSS